MKPTPSPDYIDEIVVALRPRLSSEQSTPFRYDALIFAEPSVNVSVREQASREERPVGDLPLRGVEWARINWKSYREYLAMFHGGDKAADMMRNRIFETVSPGLGGLVETLGNPTRRTRIWWSCESPETEELPWELVLQPQRRSMLSFVRGLPAPPRVLVPRRGNLKLAIVADEPKDVDALHIAKLDNIDTKVFIGKPIRDTLAEVVAQGVELLHIVGNGSTFASWQSTLELANEKISPLELCTRIRASRLVAVGLSPARSAVEHASDHAPTVFRAFSHLGSAIDATSVVAQLGPWSPNEFPMFAAVYETLAKTSSIEVAVHEVRVKTNSFAPLALYLRQRLGRELVERAPTVQDIREPQHAQAQLDAGRNMIEQLKAIQSRFPNSNVLSGSAAFKEHEERVDELSAKLESWTKLGEDER